VCVRPHEVWSSRDAVVCVRLHDHFSQVTWCARILRRELCSVEPLDCYDCLEDAPRLLSEPCPFINWLNDQISWKV
jgi:hypothetical protein